MMQESLSKQRNRIVAAAGGVVVGYAMALFIFYAKHFWLIDAQSHPMTLDFVAFWAAGRLALSGHATAAYNVHLQHAAEAAVIGHGYKTILGWSYPPPFLFIASGLALMPYLVALAVWCVGTLALYAAIVAAIYGRREAAVFACAAPWVPTMLLAGQNGFFTASLVGLFFLLLRTRPAAAGLVLGLLSYKPQLGILFPFALAAGGHWRAFVMAGASLLLLNAAACAVFGFDTLGAFFHALSVTSQSHLNGGLDWKKLQTVYGLFKALGAPGFVAWPAQAIVAIALAAIVIWVWRSPLDYSLKAACLTAAIPLATPYVFQYDLAVLSVAIAYLGRSKSFDRTEMLLLASTVPSTYVYLMFPLPTALFASLAVMTIVLRRLWNLVPAMTNALPSRSAAVQ